LLPAVKDIVAELSPAVADNDVGALGATPEILPVSREVPTTPDGAEVLVAVTTERIKLPTSLEVSV
jgi:hypothetical protein